MAKSNTKQLKLLEVNDILELDDDYKKLLTKLQNVPPQDISKYV